MIVYVDGSFVSEEEAKSLYLIMDFFMEMESLKGLKHYNGRIFCSR